MLMGKKSKTKWFGYISERGNDDYPHLKKVKHYSTVVKKKGIDKNVAIDEAQRLGWVLGEEHFDKNVGGDVGGGTGHDVVEEDVVEEKKGEGQVDTNVIAPLKDDDKMKKKKKKKKLKDKNGDDKGKGKGKGKGDDKGKGKGDDKGKGKGDVDLGVDGGDKKKKKRGRPKKNKKN